MNDQQQVEQKREQGEIHVRHVRNETITKRTEAQLYKIDRFSSLSWLDLAIKQVVMWWTEGECERLLFEIDGQLRHEHSVSSCCSPSSTKSCIFSKI